MIFVQGKPQQGNWDFSFFGLQQSLCGNSPTRLPYGGGGGSQSMHYGYPGGPPPGQQPFYPPVHPPHLHPHLHHSHPGSPRNQPPPLPSCPPVSVTVVTGIIILQTFCGFFLFYFLLNGVQSYGNRSQTLIAKPWHQRSWWTWLVKNLQSIKWLELMRASFFKNVDAILLV